MADLAGLPIPSVDWLSPNAPQAFKKFKARCELYFSEPLKEKLKEEQISYLLIGQATKASNWSPREILFQQIGRNLAPTGHTSRITFLGKETLDSRGTSSEPWNKNLMSQSIHLLRKLKFLWKNVNLRIQMNISSMLSSSGPIPNVRKPSFLSDISTRFDALKHGQTSKSGITPGKPRGDTIRLCGCCGMEHDISQRSFCSAYGLTCGACGKENHWRKFCRASKANK